MKAAVRRVGGLESPTAKIDGINERVDADIAILDGGIQPDHPDLNVAGGHNCVGKGTSWDDRDGHGTIVAGARRGERQQDRHRRYRARCEVVGAACGPT